MSPSSQHGYVCGNLIALLKPLKQFTIFSELTIQIEKDYIPDICIYPRRKIDFAAGDIIRMTEMPLAVVEVLSPKQTITELMEKFEVYFPAGVKSCWLVIPPAQTVTVYTAPGQGHIFHAGNVVDTVLKIEIPIEEVFM
jgi:Uma2 family endonuclease